MGRINRWRQRLVSTVKVLIRGGLIVINDGFILLPVKKEQVIFESFNGNDINDNPMAIYQELVQQRPELRQSCYFNVKPRRYAELHAKYPELQLLKRFHFAWIWRMARADYWIFNSRMPNWWHKNRHTHYIQTWHGTPLKHLGLDIADVEIPGTNTTKYQQQFVREVQRWDALIAPNAYSQQIFARAFQFHGQWLKTGYPRNDKLQQPSPNRVRQLKQSLVGKADVPVILYAPTWRDDDFQKVGQYNFQLPFDLGKFFAQVSAETILVLRPHYLVKDHIDIRGYEQRVKILAEADIAELYLISDLLITDYSSVMFDYAILQRPQLFFAYDLEHYRDQLRGFYFDYPAALPGPMVTTEADFDQRLAEFQQNGRFAGFDQQQAAFEKRFTSWEHGDAAKRVLQQIGLIGGTKHA